MKHFICKKCHKHFTSTISVSTCPYCHSVNISYLGLAASGLKMLGKILSQNK